MTKSGKKKNSKLRRRVQRTIAAVTMITAVVVAAIPVESFGTMRAANNTRAVDITDLDYGEVSGTSEYPSGSVSKKYNAHYNSGTYENGYNDGTIQVQHVDGSNFTNVFEADKKADGTAKVTKKLLSNNVTSLTIGVGANEYEYYDYVRFDIAFINAVQNAYQTVDFDLEYANGDTRNFSGGTVTVTDLLDSSNQPTSVNLTAITLNKINSNSVPTSTTNKQTVSITTDSMYQGYENFPTSGNLNIIDIYQKCWKSEYDNQLNNITAYNSAVDAAITELNNIQNKISAGSGITNAEYTAWTNYANGSLQTQYNNAKKISHRLDQFPTQSNKENLNTLTEYIICQTGQKDNNNKLDSFELSTVVDTDTGQTYYMPKRIGNTGLYTGQIDGNGYLATGRVTIDGIGTGAFSGDHGNGNYVQTLVLPSTLRYIGKEAFSNSNLRNVTIKSNSLEIIGERAFAEDSNLQTLTFDGSNSSSGLIIDQEAFANTGITSLTVPDYVATIGAGAFSGTRIGDLKFSDTARRKDLEIGSYAFYNCASLSSVEFPDKSSYQYKIGKAAFALSVGSGGGLSEFVFPGSNTAIKYTGIDLDDCDYILTNRTSLADVTFPGELRNTTPSSIPNRTLAGCTNLGHVLFLDGASGASYDPSELFRDIYNVEFYVEGPQWGATGEGTNATPRTITWEAYAGEILDDSNNVTGYALTAVPYMFTDKNGKVHFELGKREDEDYTKNPLYVATVDVIDGTTNAVLSKYEWFENKTPTKNMSITIPDKVSRYTVIEIGEGCFGDNIRPYVYELIIQDGSIQKINEGAFKDSKNLQWVEIGDAVTFIGKEAFAECPKLENVVFSQTQTEFFESDDPYWGDLQIEENAFKTGSTYLTFHGAINENYAPFKLAMSENSSNMTSQRSGCQICYKTDAPLNLTVIRDNGTGKATLIDYPHYEEIDTINKALIDKRREEAAAQPGTPQIPQNYSITDTFETVNEIGNKTNGSDIVIPSEDNNIVRQTLFMDLPSGIQSIDSKAYFLNTNNSEDFAYFNKIYENDKTNAKYTDGPGNNQDRDVNKGTTGSVPGIGGTDKYDLYATYENIPTNGETSIPGLFSGFFKESVITESDAGNPSSFGGINGFIWSTYDNHRYVENNERGNDYLTSINLETVEELSDFAFDSAENLKSVTIGSAMDEMGQQPFRDCKSLYQIDTSASTKYEYENMILYDKAPADGSGGYKIVQGLEGRGRDDVTDGNYGSRRINVTTNPLLAQVTDIAPYAFANNEEIYEADLSASNVRNIQQGTFSGCGVLESVVLPERTRNIGDFAFEGVNEGRNFTLTIPNKDCQISQKAFDFDVTGHVTIKGIMYEDEATKDPSVTYDSYLELDKTYGNKVEWADLGSTYTLRFLDASYKEFDSIEIENGGTLKNPPQAPTITGKKFKEWICLDATDSDGNPLRGEATYSNVTEDRRIMATYEDDPSIVVPDGNEYNLTVVGGTAVINGSSVDASAPIKVKGGTSVTVMATDSANFKVWTITPGTYISLLMNASSPATTFTMPNADVVITANTAISGGDEPTPDGKYTVTVNSGTGSGTYAPGETVTITANTPAAGQSFTGWTTTNTGVTFASSGSTTTTFVMPSSNVTVTANYTGGSNDPNNPDDPNKKYRLTVNYGTGSGEYASGETVTITANPPDSSRRVFSRWTTNNSTVTLASATSATTTLVMPAADLTVTANYRSRSDDDDDDDDNNNRRPGTNTNTNTVTNRPGNSTNTNGTTGTVSNNTNGTNGTNGNNGSNNDGGSRIYITKNGVSNKDLASVSVSGSTDNFIVRITESEEATAAVEEALINRYGSLDGLAYFPMDISLYDSTGQNKITDTYGLNITVTMPIPDVLIQYGGNNRVAAADNGNLQQLTPRFTTIDGIACISFVPPHFSPYVIYVDTNNLTAGQTLDSTPKTGDPIHPKWFAAIGMACLSVILFVTSDGRGRKRKKLTV